MSFYILMYTYVFVSLTHPQNLKTKKGIILNLSYCSTIKCIMNILANWMKKAYRQFFSDQNSFPKFWKKLKQNNYT